MLDSTTKKRIDDARDILVGKIPDPKSQVEQITIALIYKFMDDMDMESEELGGNAKFFVGEYAKYSWRKVYNKTRGGQEILVDYSAALTAMSNNSDLPSIFHTIFKQAYLPYNDPETLKEFLKQINLFDYDHSEKLGDAFEYLLSVLGSQGDAGQFRTPRHIIDFMVDVVEPKKNETILDPACGTAGFLISAYKYILAANSGEENQLTPDERKQLSENIVGYDISPDMVRLSLVNMYLHRLTNPKISEYDTLTSDAKWGEYFDVVLANPPFMSPKGGIKPHSRFSVQSKRSEALFVDYIAEHLTHTGRGAVIVPEGVIFKSDASFKKLRKMLVDENYLYGVISLPSGVFNPYSGVKTSILLFDKCVARQTDKLIFAKVENDGFALGAQRRPIEGSQLPAITSMIKAFRTAVIDGKEFESDNCTLVEKSKIAEGGDYNLSGERYVEKLSVTTTYKRIALKEICKINPAKSEVKDITDIAVSFLPMADLGENTISFNTTQQKNIDEVRSGYTYFADNDVLLAKVTPCFENGKAGIARDLVNGIGFGSSEFYILRASDETIPEWLYYNIKHIEFHKKAIASMTGTGGLQRIPKSFVESFEIPLPSIEEQKAIVTEIESYQKIIDAARTIVDNYRPQITIDPEWEMVDIKDAEIEIIDGDRGSNYPNKSELTDTGYCLFLNTSNVRRGFFSFENCQYVSKEKDDSLRKGKVQSNDLILTTRGTIGNIAHFDNSVMFQTARINSGMVILRVNRSVLDAKYVLCLFLSDNVGVQITNLSSGAAQPQLPIRSLNSIKIPLPSIETQQQIVAEIEREQKAVDSAKELIEIFEQKIKKRIAKIWGE